MTEGEAALARRATALAQGDAAAAAKEWTRLSSSGPGPGVFRPGDVGPSRRGRPGRDREAQRAVYNAMMAEGKAASRRGAGQGRERLRDRVQGLPSAEARTGPRAGEEEDGRGQIRFSPVSGRLDNIKAFLLIVNRNTDAQGLSSSKEVPMKKRRGSLWLLAAVLVFSLTGTPVWPRKKSPFPKPDELRQTNVCLEMTGVAFTSGMTANAQGEPDGTAWALIRSHGRAAGSLWERRDAPDQRPRGPPALLGNAIFADGSKYEISQIKTGTPITTSLSSRSRARGPSRPSSLAIPTRSRSWIPSWPSAIRLARVCRSPTA